MRETFPQGWRETQFSNYCLITMGQSPPGITYNANGNGLPFFQGKAEFGKIYPTPKKYCSAPKKTAEKGDILLSVRAPVGPTNICKNYSCIGRGLASIRAYQQESQSFIYFYLLSIENWLSKQGAGSTFQAIGKEFIYNLPTPIPPLNEQKRMVAKLDAIIPRIDSLKARVDKIPTLIKRFRQSVLTAAVTGKLTEKWREKRNVSDKWFTTTLDEQSEYITSGSRGWARYYSKSGAIFVRAQNINTDNLVLDDVAFVELPNKTEGLRTRIFKNDILITITGANVTKTALVKTDISEAYVNQHVALVRLKKPIFSEYIYLWLVSPTAGRAQLEETAYGAGKPGLNLKNIKDVDITLPPLEEQKEIVRQVDNLFALADKLETHYYNAKVHMDKLSQSVLAKAFRGELVPQDPNDEPAEKLLERIMAEKAKVESALKGGKKKGGGQKAKAGN